MVLGIASIATATIEDGATAQGTGTTSHMAIDDHKGDMLAGDYGITDAVGPPACTTASITDQLLKKKAEQSLADKHTAVIDYTGIKHVALVLVGIDQKDLATSIGQTAYFAESINEKTYTTDVITGQEEVAYIFPDHMMVIAGHEITDDYPGAMLTTAHMTDRSITAAESTHQVLQSSHDVITGTDIAGTTQVTMGSHKGLMTSRSLKQHDAAADTTGRMYTEGILVNAKIGELATALTCA